MTRRRDRSLDTMTPKQLERHVAKLLADATRTADVLRRPDRGRWQRSRATRAICNAGRWLRAASHSALEGARNIDRLLKQRKEIPR